MVWVRHPFRELESTAAFFGKLGKLSREYGRNSSRDWIAQVEITSTNVDRQRFHKFVRFCNTHGTWVIRRVTLDDACLFRELVVFGEVFLIECVFCFCGNGKKAIFLKKGGAKWFERFVGQLLGFGIFLSQRVKGEDARPKWSS